MKQSSKKQLTVTDEIRLFTSVGFGANHPGPLERFIDFRKSEE
ncbi:unnamed protein product [Larinioides sclopetarius]|uniref:Uncharacterized protein n=1 Tax=Larinioides sclopetarius TaxID=280406 RepID=A0AAV2B6V2_9ARAC